ELGNVPVVADLDGDGHSDAVVSQLQVALDRDGRLGGLRNLEAKSTSLDPTEDVTGVDLNGDGAADLAVTHKYSNGKLYLSNHDGTFQSGVPWQANTYIRQTKAGDFNGD